jgi:glycosyltransferase involved in cell wall biosynthesis
MEVIHKTNCLPDRVEVVGGVDDLGKWYRRARFAVAPIFDGSGMKTKVAEALMHGKRIIGTSVAFEGYDDALPSAGWICNDADAFIKAIQAAQLADLSAMDPSLRQLYLDHYSLEAATKHFERILSS